MCFVTPPAPKQVDMPIRENVTSTDDAAQIAAAEEKKRKGFSSTVATTPQGLMDTAKIGKVQLGT